MYALHESNFRSDRLRCATTTSAIELAVVSSNARDLCAVRGTEDVVGVKARENRYSLEKQPIKREGCHASNVAHLSSMFVVVD
eukprot:COSAG02_NODE_1567_length_11900_cov_6.050250_14_plen_83_part_00